MRFSVRRLSILTVAALVAMSSVGAVAPSASGDAIGDKRAQAAQISAQIDQLDRQMDQLGQQYDAAQEKLASVQGQIDASTKAVAAANAKLHTAKRQLTSYAVEAYVRGGESDLPDMILNGTGQQVVPQVEYLKSATTDRSDLIDQVRVARFQASHQLDQLHAAQDAARALQTQLGQQKAAAEQAAGQQQALLTSVKGELATLVAQAQAAAAAQAEAAAKARLAATSPTTPGKTGPNRPPATPPPGSDPTPGPVVDLPVPGGPVPPLLAATARGIAIARQYIGTPYQWGGASPSTGFDCSGLVQYSYGQAGLRLPRVADDQARATRHITYADAQAGDLVFFDTPVGHVGIYLGGGMMLDAPHTGAFVRIEPIWWSTLVGFGRVV